MPIARAVNDDHAPPGADHCPCPTFDAGIDGPISSIFTTIKPKPQPKPMAVGVGAGAGAAQKPVVDACECTAITTKSNPKLILKGVGLSAGSEPVVHGQASECTPPCSDQQQNPSCTAVANGKLIN